MHSSCVALLAFFVIAGQTQRDLKAGIRAYHARSYQDAFRLLNQPLQGKIDSRENVFRLLYLGLTQYRRGDENNARKNLVAALRHEPRLCPPTHSVPKGARVLFYSLIPEQAGGRCEARRKNRKRRYLRPKPDGDFIYREKDGAVDRSEPSAPDESGYLDITEVLGGGIEKSEAGDWSEPGPAIDPKVELPEVPWEELESDPSRSQLGAAQPNNTLAWVLLSSGVVALGTGTGFGIDAFSKSSAARAEPVFDDQVSGLNAANRSGRVSLVALAVGSLAIGAAWFLFE